MKDEEALKSHRHEWVCQQANAGHRTTINALDGYAAGFRAGLAHARKEEPPGPLKNETKLRAALADFMSDWCIAPGTEGQPRLAGDEPCESDVDELISIFRSRG